MKNEPVMVLQDYNAVTPLFYILEERT